MPVVPEPPVALAIAVQPVSSTAVAVSGLTVRPASTMLPTPSVAGYPIDTVVVPALPVNAVPVLTWAIATCYTFHSQSLRSQLFVPYHVDLADLAGADGHQAEPRGGAEFALQALGAEGEDGSGADRRPEDRSVAGVLADGGVSGPQTEGGRDPRSGRCAGTCARSGRSPPFQR